MQSAFAPLKTVPRNTNHRSNICSYTFVHTLKPRFPHSGTPLHDHGPATLTTSRRRQYRIDNAPRRSDLQCANAASNLDPLIRWQLGWTMHFIAIHLIDLRACAHARSYGGHRAMCEAIFMQTGCFDVRTRHRGTRRVAHPRDAQGRRLQLRGRRSRSRHRW